MTIKKGDLFKTSYSNQLYRVAGKWGKDIVLVPVNPDDEECLIYTYSEVEEMVETGKFQKIERSAK